MKKLLKAPGMLAHDVPAGLDSRILLYAGLEAARRRRKRRWRFAGVISGMAAAAAVVAVVFLPGPADVGGKGGELLELSDWTTLEQESFNLASQLNCGWQEMPELRNS